ncbi:hypothetical protein PsYK624_050760 [Phanerochaete sordida]|uniref:Uncharacterized protein n=1 Tax=Phanerochaete sordida TaxID=48140 RepID=A0A9P3G4H1_9APHY|nr:hypothetical protein PsYK624_050760 [Phanerochaete sordida]
MAALYLHQALFANDTPPPSAQPLRNSRGPHDLSLSGVTLRTSTSEGSHPTEPLLNGPYGPSAAYQDILASQPVYSESHRASWTTALSLAGDPLSATERKRHWELQIRAKLRRLRWAKRVLKGVIAAWGVYTTVRYFVAFTIYTARDRQIVLLVLGTASALSLASALLPLLLSFFLPQLRRQYHTRSLHVRISALFDYAASLLLLGPAVANLAFVAIWRHSADPALSAQGRCHWDIDVVWTGTGLQCSGSNAVAWGSWLAGSIVRLVLTALILVTYHGVSHRYLATRAPRRRRGARTHSHSMAFGARAETLNSSSTRSLHTMVSTSTTPIVAPRMLRKDSAASTSDLTHESSLTAVSSSSRPRTLRRSQSRISADRLSADVRPRPVRPLSADRSLLSSDGHGSTTIRFAHDRDAASTGSSAEDLSAPPDAGSSHYGSAPGAHALSATPGVPPATGGQGAPDPARRGATQEEMEIFVERFRAMMEQVARETEAGLELAQRDGDEHEHDGRHGHGHDGAHYADDTLPSPADSYGRDDDDYYVPVVGKIIQRMPTIESLGSRELMSLASGPLGGDRSAHTLSRPPTRANTLTMSEVAGSPSVSRSNSITASVVLAHSPVEAPSPSSELFGAGARAADALNGSRGTALPRAAAAAGLAGVDSAAGAGCDADWTHHGQ